MADTTPMTDKQAAVLAFVEHFTAAQRWSPTRREIADHFGWRAANSAEVHIKALIKKGRLKRRVGCWHVARSLDVVVAAG